MEKDLDSKGTNAQAAQEKGKVFMSWDSPVSFANSNFIDEQRLKIEQPAIIRHIGSQEVELVRITSAMPDKDRSRIAQIQTDLNESVKWGGIVEDDLDKVEASPESYTRRRLRTMDEVRLGIDLFQLSKINDIALIAKRHGFDEKLAPFIRLTTLNAAGSLLIRIGAVTLQDFMDVNRNTDPSAYYRFLVEAHITTPERQDKIFEENQDFPKNLYPNTAKQAIVILQNSISSVCNPTITPEKSGKNPVLKRSIEMFLRLAKCVEDVQERTRKGILNPESEDFASLSELVGRYLVDKDKRVRIVAANQLGFNTLPKIVETYRKARKYEKEDKSGEFYMILGDVVFEYIDEASGLTSLLTNEDVEAILDNDKEQPANIEQDNKAMFERFGKFANAISSMTSQREFVVEPEKINWGQLHVPQNAEISFDTNNPRKLIMKIAFSNEVGESTEVECVLDTVKNIMDWNHHEDPMELLDNSDLINLRASLLAATQSILENVYVQAQEDHQLKLQSRRIASQSSVVQGPKREKSQDPVYQLRKDTRAQQRADESESEVMLYSLSSQQKVKNIVIFPSDDEYRDLEESLSHTDRVIVRKAIEEYNEKATGAKFSQKKARGPDNRPIFGISIGCTKPGGARIFLHETESGDRLRKFEIVDIRYRKDIYRKNKL